MTRIVLSALVLASSLGAAAVPAQAQVMAISLPDLTFPAPPSPTVPSHPHSESDIR